jgi:MFS superfamily sulfate permease-like transporter
MHILESFACGLAFAMGVTSFFFIRDLATAKGRSEIKEEMHAHAKRVEDRLAIQVSTMLACLEEIKKKP